LFADPALFSKYTPPFGGVDPVGPGLRVSPPEVKFYHANPPEEQLLFAGPHPILNAYTPIWLGGPLGPRVKGEPPEIKFYHANPPRRATFVYWPPPNS
jgi:hypothetical protein